MHKGVDMCAATLENNNCSAQTYLLLCDGHSSILLWCFIGAVLLNRAIFLCAEGILG